MNWFIQYISIISEILATILGFIYILLSIRQNILLWPIGLLSSLLFIVVFYQSALYANMGLQGYYVIMSIYGWYYWSRGNLGLDGKQQDLPVKRMSGFTMILSIIAGVLIQILIFYILSHTNSPIPFWDAATTTLSIVATWMLARKYIENWTLWIVTDAISTGLYLKMHLYLTSLLFIAYTILAVIGYVEWKKSIQLKKNY